jgi:DtxR family transcriptional regulator, manganese transport regulator
MDWTCGVWLSPSFVATATRCSKGYSLTSELVNEYPRRHRQAVPAEKPTSTRTRTAKRAKSASAPRGPNNAEIQQHTRKAHHEERAQDYVEAIADLIESHGEARVTDLAKALGVTHVTVIRTVQRLQREGYVTNRPYRAIFLTETGAKLAATARERHITVVAFLETLGIPRAIALRDAEGIEHHVSPETLAAFRKAITSKKAPSEKRTRPK